MFNPMSLDGKKVLITGASSGIGRACSFLASRLGASVVLTARRAEALAETVRQMDNPGAHAVVPGDVTQAGFLKEIVSVCGKLDGFVHAAGISLVVPLRCVESADLHRVYETNVLAFVELMKTFANRRLANPGFSAVAISSVAAAAGWSGVAAYAGSKGALSATIRCLAIELASARYRVNAVCPSNIQTPMFDELTQGLDRQQVLDSILPKQPLGIGRPEEVAAAVCFLLSPASSFITGVNLPVDGGYLAQ